MSQQTDIDFTEKQPTALMRLEAILNDRFVDEKSLLHRERNYTIKMVLHIIKDLKPSELADLKQSFCEGGIETESAETWAKKWGVGGG
jgi:transcription elongation factor GreA-like protein